MASSTSTTPVLLADDDAAVRAGLRRYLEGTGEFRVVGEAANGLEAVNQTDALQPAAVLLDVSMPGMDSFEVVRSVKERHPGVAVVFSMHADERYFPDALRAGAQGYVPKSAPAPDVAEALRVTSRGQIYFHPSVGQLLLDSFLRAEALLHLRTRVIAAASHSLKQPLGVIRLRTELLREEIATGSLGAENLAEALTQIETGVIRMDRLLDELTDHARVPLEPVAGECHDGARNGVVRWSATAQPTLTVPG